jgi:hypothetical protein
MSQIGAAMDPAGAADADARAATRFAVPHARRFATLAA